MATDYFDVPKIAKWEHFAALSSPRGHPKGASKAISKATPQRAQRVAPRTLGAFLTRSSFPICHTPFSLYIADIVFVFEGSLVAPLEHTRTSILDMLFEHIQNTPQPVFPSPPLNPPHRILPYPLINP